MNDFVKTVTVYLLPVLFAITFHEAAHAFIAKYFGDNTAYIMGHMSFNPFKHIDPIGTIVIPIILYVATSGTFLFGYARSVPLDFNKLKQSKANIALIALAGPTANFIMAILWTLVIYILTMFNIQETFFLLMAKAGVLINLTMFAFNLLPIPPLDGGRVLTIILPYQYSNKFSQIEPYGLFIVMVLLILKILHILWITPVIYLANQLLQLIVSPLFLFLN